jgi:glycosyltransferase involved in cell wall biosynthesis
MRILLANEARQGAGGVESYLAALAPHLEARGHDVALLFGNPSTDTGPTRIVTSESWSVADEGIERAMAGARAWRPDVCFSHNMRRLDVDERLVSEGQRAGWRTFKMMHGYFGTCVSGHKAFSVPHLEPCTRICGPGCLVYYLPRKCGQLRPDVMAAQYGWARRQRRLFPLYAGIVVASDHMRREYLRYNISAGRIHRIPLFSTVPPSPVESTSAPAGSTEPRIDVVFLGRMTPLKGPEQLVRALPHVASALGRPVTALVAGEGPERDRMRDLAGELGPAGRFTAEFPGWIDAQARAAIFSRASLVAIPSIWPEPFGLVGLEAAQFGVPSVAFDVGGIREWLTDGVNGRLVDLTGGAPALGAAIASVLGDRPMHARLASGARAAAARFSVDAYVTALERVLAS